MCQFVQEKVGGERQLTLFQIFNTVSSLIKTTADLDEYKSEISPYFDNNSVIEEIYGMAQSVNIQIDDTNDDEDTR